MVAVAECFRGDGEILANPIGTIPMIGGRLARASFEPDLVMTDGEALLVANAVPRRRRPTRRRRRGVEPVPLDVRRRVVGPPPRDDGRAARSTGSATRTSRSSATGTQPKAQLLGFRGAPGNTIHNTTSYWIPNHSPKVFVPEGRRRVAASATTAPPTLGPSRCRLPRAPPRRHQPRRARLRDARPPHAPAVGAPGRDRRRGRRGHRLRARRRRRRARDRALPTDDELALIREVIDPHGLRDQEVPNP